MVFSRGNERFVDEVVLQHFIDELKIYINEKISETPEDMGDSENSDTIDYVTKTELQTILDDLNLDVDLSSCVTKEELKDAIDNLNLSDYVLKEDIPEIQPLDDYATKEYVDEKYSNIFKLEPMSFRVDEEGNLILSYENEKLDAERFSLNDRGELIFTFD